MLLVFGGDADDLGALAILNNYENSNTCNLLAIMFWSTEPSLQFSQRIYLGSNTEKPYSKSRIYAYA